MATLTPGEKARMYALGAIMRGGASRGGYVSSAVFVAIDGVSMANRVLLGSLTITDELDETPNTCGFRVKDVVPAAGAEVIITLGSKNAAGRLYAGFALTVQQLYVGDKPANVQADVRCVDYTWQFGFLTVTRQYRSQSASAIAADLVARYAAANGFTSTAVVANLPPLDEITFTNEPLDAALTRIARRIGGYWFVDYQKDVHLFLEDTANAPEALTPTHTSLRAFQTAVDRTQVLTRVYVEGRGSNVLATVGAGASLLPLAAVDMFDVGPNVFVKVSPQGSSGGAQHLTFTGVTPGGAGALVGSGTAPSSVPVLTPTGGGAVTVGLHHYGYTWRSASGESMVSPAAAITITSTAPTAVAPSVAVAAGTGLAAADTYGTQASYAYGVTHVTAAGETAVSGIHPAAWVSVWDAKNPTDSGPPTYYTRAGLQATNGRGDANGSTNIGVVGDRIVGRIAFRSTTALQPASLGPQSAEVVLMQYLYQDGTSGPVGTAGAVFINMTAAPDRWNCQYLDYQINNLTKGGGWKTVSTQPARYPNGYGYFLHNVSFGPAATDTPGVLANAAVTVTVNDGGAEVTKRRVYRTHVNGAQLYFLKEVAGSAETSFVDTTPDSALVTVAPAGTGPLQTVTVTGIATGPKGSGGGPVTTARTLYRTTAGLTSWGVLATIADNTTTTFVDTLADASLGVGGPPISDTSGLVADGGQVLAGITTIPVSGTGAFPPAGGWVLSGNNRIRYTGVTGSALTGIPASGDGAILNTIPYGTPVTLAPMLTGVGGITAPIVAGDEVYLVVQADDPARQATVADMVNGGPGIREEWVQDRRLSIPEAQARAQATLQMRPLEDVTISYVCRDVRTASGKTITVNLPAPTNVWGAFKIQSVTINNFRPHPNQNPTYTVTASSRRFSFEDWLRRMETSV